MIDIKMNEPNVKNKMMELNRPIDEAILMCDSREEILMLASMMLISIKDIFDTQIGIDGRKDIFKSMLK
jgi:hypothetical protein